ncbi:hypothetical protein [Neisseria sp. Ec49-e6-T10]|uniref:hypothetical protein n=1 Tax=Neisseria sp. Ec49-e6-T10 TaxID=3140744 RepID=UPI003EC117D8
MKKNKKMIATILLAITFISPSISYAKPVNIAKKIPDTFKETWVVIGDTKLEKQYCKNPKKNENLIAESFSINTKNNTWVLDFPSDYTVIGKVQSLTEATPTKLKGMARYSVDSYHGTSDSGKGNFEFVIKNNRLYLLQHPKDFFELQESRLKSQGAIRCTQN